MSLLTLLGEISFVFFVMLPALTLLGGGVLLFRVGPHAFHAAIGLTLLFFFAVALSLALKFQVIRLGVDEFCGLLSFPSGIVCLLCVRAVASAQRLD